MSVVSVFYNGNFTSVYLKIRYTHLLHPFPFCKIHNFLRVLKGRKKRQTEFIIVFLLAAGEMDLHCFNIDYFPREEYSPDPNDSTMAIPCKYQTAYTQILHTKLMEPIFPQKQNIGPLHLAFQITEANLSNACFLTFYSPRITVLY